MGKNQQKKVFVGMSGGVDSSLSAALLKERGFTVTGVFIKVWQPDFIKCTWKEDRLDAMRVAASLNIPFLTFDFEEEYKRDVIDYMLREYKDGRTPNPDVMCNRHIKFGAFWQKAKEMGADFVATGHYAQIETNPNTHEFELHMGADRDKDQTYFLWTLTQDDLSHILFPIGHLTKTKVRTEATRRRLATATKKESQGLCFVGNIDMHEFLKQLLQPRPGNVLDENGMVIGKHDGAALYTIGQRHGFVIKTTEKHAKPRFIIARDIEKNTLTVSASPQQTPFATNTVSLEQVNWNTDLTVPTDLAARFRYRQPLIASKPPRTKYPNAIEFANEKHIVPIGQSLVVYHNTRCVGGGIITC